MEIKYVLLSSLVLISISLVQAKTLMKGDIVDDNVKIKVEKDVGVWGDDQYTYEINLTGVDPFVCMRGTVERLAAYESKNYIAKFKNPEGDWCYFFALGKTPRP